MEIKQKIKKPIMPSEIYIEQPVAKKQDGFNSHISFIKVKDLTEEQANEYAELMKETFIEHWRAINEDKHFRIVFEV